MTLLEQLYRTLIGDDVTRPLDPFWRREIVTGSVAPTLVTSLVVPERKALLLSHFFARARPQALRTINSAEIRYMNAGATIFIPVSRTGALTPGDEFGDVGPFGPSQVMPAGTSLLLTATFDAGDVANQVELAMMGILVPLGTIQRV